MSPSLEKRIELRNQPNQTAALLQKWRDLAFIHWKFPEEILQTLLPKGLYIDKFENEAYIGIVPFFMRDVKPIFFGSIIPGCNFCELNVRTYVYDENGVPGVWFFSLDANHWLSVQFGKSLFLLPYFYSDFNISRDGDFIDYQCVRGKNSRTQFSFKPTQYIGRAEPGTLEFFLIERYLLFVGKEKVFSGRVYHEPYELNTVEVKVWDENVFLWNKIAATGRKPDHLIYSKGVDVKIYPLQAVSIP